MWVSRDRDESLATEGGAVGFGAESLSRQSLCLWMAAGAGEARAQEGLLVAQGRVSEEEQEKGVEWL